jgi:hypothetical protein
MFEEFDDERCHLEALTEKRYCATLAEIEQLQGRLFCPTNDLKGRTSTVSLRVLLLEASRRPGQIYHLS